MSATSDLIRSLFKQGDDIRDAGLATPEGIWREDDLVYGEDPRWQSLDVYRPRSAEGKRLPVIVSVHGGGWVYGDKERYQYYCMNLAERGFAVVNFTYRLAPEFQFPAPLEDTDLVFRWVLAHGEEYGFDREHIFAVGDSAGAHILGLYSALCTDPDYRARFSFAPPEGFVPAAVALNCGAYRIDTGKKDLTSRLMKDFLPEGGSPEELWLICVEEHITADFPPAFFMTCTGDFLKDQAPELAEKLAREKIPFVYRFYGDSRHELGHVFHCDIRSEDARRCNDEECAFFRSFCG